MSGKGLCPLGGFDWACVLTGRPPCRSHKKDKKRDRDEVEEGEKAEKKREKKKQ